MYLNVQGFLAYSVYNIALFSSPGIRKEYRERNHGHSPSVRGNDVAFAVHAFVLSVITLIQTFTYKRGAKQAVSSQASFFIAVTSTLVAILLVTASFGSVAWLDLLYYLSYLKIAISFLKLIPQVSRAHPGYVPTSLSPLPRWRRLCSITSARALSAGPYTTYSWSVPSHLFILIFLDSCLIAPALLNRT